MQEQAQRIVELKQEVNDLCIALENYRKRDSEITQVFAFAKQKAEELVEESRIKYALECERLRVYRNKWMRYINDKNKRGELAQDIEKTNRLLKECQAELEDMLYTDLGINQSVSNSYVLERERIDGEPSLDYQQIIKKAKSFNNGIEDDILPDDELEKMLAKLNI